MLSAFRLPRPVSGLRGGLLSAFCILALLLPTALPAESKFPWVYRHVELVRVVDGDTVRLNIEVAPGLWQRNQSCRLADVNAPELGTEAGEKAKLELERRLLPFVWRPPGATRYLAIEVRGRDKYGRWLVRLLDGDATWGNPGPLGFSAIRPSGQNPNRRGARPANKPAPVR